MDWPVVGAVSGVGVLTVAVLGVGAYALLSGPSPARQQQIIAAINFSSIVGPTTFPIDDGLLQPDLPPPPKPGDFAGTPQQKGPAGQRPAAPPPPPAQKKTASLPPNTPNSPNSGRPPDPTQSLGTATPHQAPAAAPAVARWRVVKTAKAGMMNLGGHIDGNGNVDGMANSHLRDALVQHANFAKLPAAIQNHIKNQTINLNTIAPYRGLLGIDDRKMEDEQGIKFVRA
jgi:hypothetical protein